MTNSDLTLIAALLDRSGSMASVADDTRGGFDELIAAEREQDGTASVTLAQFDDEYQLVYENRLIQDVPPLTLEPRGTTALLDAIGRFVTNTASDLAARPDGERPARVMVLVMTDGHENASVEWTKATVQQLVSRQQEKHHWDFVFLGANMDAIDVGTGLGFSPDRSLTYDATPEGVAGAFSSVAHYRQTTRGHVGRRPTQRRFRRSRSASRAGPVVVGTGLAPAPGSCAPDGDGALSGERRDTWRRSRPDCPGDEGNLMSVPSAKPAG